MPVREIKTTIALDGEREFKKAIDEAGRSMRVMSSEMKAAAADFDLSGDRMDYLGKKSQSLKDQIKQQEAIIKSLEGAVKDSADSYGDASAKTDGYRIKLNNARASMSKMQRELEETDREMADLGRDSGRVGRQLENGIGDAADDVSGKFDGMLNKLSTDIGGIAKTTKIGVALEVAGNIADAVTGAYEAVTGFVDESAEYNRTMSFLEINAENAGHSFEKIKEYAISVTGLTGDMDAAVEGMSNLLQTGFEADEMALAVARLSGAIIQFPDTMKFESLADSLQESIATGSAVGQYAEYLERMGLDLETVNEALAEAKKTGQEAVETTALSFLSENNAEETLAQYQQKYADQIEYFEAQAKLTDAQADLAAVLTPAATTAMELATGLVEAATGLVSAATEMYKERQKEKEAEREEKWKAEAEVEQAVEQETGAYSELDRLNEAIRAADMAGDYAETARLMQEREKQIHIIAEATAAIEEANATEEKAAEETSEKTGEKGARWIDSLSEQWKTANEDLTENASEYAKNAKELINEKMSETFAEPASADQAAWMNFQNMLAAGAGDTSAIGAEKANEMLSGMSDYLIENTPAVETDAETSGENIPLAFGNGVINETPYAVSSVQAMMASMQAELNRGLVMPSVTGGAQYTGGTSGSAGSGSSITVPMSIDGKNFGTATASYSSSAMGKLLARAEKYG